MDRAKGNIENPEGKLEYNKALFARVAPKYGVVNNFLSLGRDSVWKDRLVDALPGLERPSCLDLACGTGDIAFRLAEKYPGGSVVGLDVTEAMIERARRRNRYDNVKFVVGDMTRTPFNDEGFDIVTGGYALRNAPDLGKALDETARLLKTGGTGAFLDFSKPANRVARRIEYALLRPWCAFCGLMLFGSSEVCTYIVESLKQYPDRESLKRQLKARGFGNITSERYYLGIIEALTFVKMRNC